MAGKELMPRHGALFLGASLYRGAGYGKRHPLAIPRVSLTQDLIQACGALLPEEFQEARRASLHELSRFHDRDYLNALMRCEALGKVPEAYRRRYGLGNLENPYFPGIFSIPATASGASIQGAEAVLGGKVAFNPAGGMHHAFPDRARGFCFLNDPVLAILRLRQEGLRVLYWDMDAHFGDGVARALRHDGATLAVSIHMDTRYAYPFEGGGMADVPEVNLPLPKGISDAEYAHAFGRLWPAVMEAFRPDAVVLQAGADALGADPLGKFRLSIRQFLAVARRMVADAPRHPDGTPKLLVLGGGGYHPIALARCWAGLWGVLRGRELPEALPEAGRKLLAAVDWDDDEVALEAPCEGPVRPEVRARVERLLDVHPLFKKKGAVLRQAP
ncbi:MAG: acetoin utilization protein AcuC [Gammaproteobacteria bacterium]|nr:MAG: acetoin utilization protein AcuC [Gammaproteobacteria bacterium]